MCSVAPNGLRYLRWGGDGEAVQLEKCWGVENCLGFAQNPQRQVHALLVCPTFGRLSAQKPEPCLNWLDFTRATNFYKPDFILEIKTDLKKRRSREPAKTFAKNWLYKKVTMPEKTNLAKKPKPNLPKLLRKTLMPILATWFCKK